MKYIDYVKSILPDHYTIYESFPGIIKCTSPIGIDDNDSWYKFKLKTIRTLYPAFQEFYHKTLSKHRDFSILYRADISSSVAAK